MREYKRSGAIEEIQKYLDVNFKDKEGTTAICFAFRSGLEDLIDVFMKISHKRIDLNSNAIKYGAPIHMSILKHNFVLALRLIEEKGVFPHSLNSNGSNAMHVLFANFMSDEDNAKILANALIHKNININLVDTNGLTPLHVAIKKNQTKALEFAFNYNNSLLLSTDAGQETKKVQKFDFNIKAKKKQTPLHYAISKTNFEAFLFMLSNNLSNIWSLDEQFKTPRAISLINSAFYKILFKMEQ